MSGRVVVEIDQLVVEGIAGSERGVVALALRRELERLLEEQGLPGDLGGAGGVPVLEADIDITGQDRAAAIGAKAGQALYRGLTR